MDFSLVYQVASCHNMLIYHVDICGDSWYCPYWVRRGMFSSLDELSNLKFAMPSETLKVSNTELIESFQEVQVIFR